MTKNYFKDNINVHKIGNIGNINKQMIIFKTFTFTLDIILHILNTNSIYYIQYGL